MCGSWNSWVCVSLQILTKGSLSVCFHNKREILDLRPFASALNRPASKSLIHKIGDYSPGPIADYNLPIPVLLCYTGLNTHHFYLFLTFIRKKIHSSQNRIRVISCSQILFLHCETTDMEPVCHAVCLFTSQQWSWYQIVLLGDRGTCVWTTCLRSLSGSVLVRSWTCASELPQDYKSNTLPLDYQATLCDLWYCIQDTAIEWWKIRLE